MGNWKLWYLLELVMAELRPNGEREAGSHKMVIGDSGSGPWVVEVSWKPYEAPKAEPIPLESYGRVVDHGDGTASIVKDVAE